MLSKNITIPCSAKIRLLFDLILSNFKGHIFYPAHLTSWLLDLMDLKDFHVILLSATQDHDCILSLSNPKIVSSLKYSTPAFCYPVRTLVLPFLSLCFCQCIYSFFLPFKISGSHNPPFCPTLPSSFWLCLLSCLFLI